MSLTKLYLAGNTPGWGRENCQPFFTVYTVLEEGYVEKPAETLTSIRLASRNLMLLMQANPLRGHWQVGGD
jgi:hypothetical protein